MNKCQHTFVQIDNKVVGPGITAKPHNLSTTAVVPIDATKFEKYSVVVCPYCGHTRHVHDDGNIEVIRDIGRVTFKKDVE